VTKRDKKKGRNRISRTTKSMRKTIKRNMKDDEIEEKRHEE